MNYGLGPLKGYGVLVTNLCERVYGLAVAAWG